MPSIEELPDGPQRALVAALHDLYRGAGKPSVREIAETIKNDDRLPGTFSPDTVSKVLRGAVVPSWTRLQALIKFFCGIAVRPVDVADQLETFHGLWLAASDETLPKLSDVAASSLDQNELGSRTSIPDSGEEVADLQRLVLEAWHRYERRDASLRKPAEKIAGFLLAESNQESDGDRLTANNQMTDGAILAALAIARLPGRAAAKLALNGLRFARLPWDGASLRQVSLRRADIPGARLRRADLSLGILTGANISRGSFSYGAFGGADLSGADLTFCDFTRANLMFVSAAGSKMGSTNFESASVQAGRFDNSAGSHLNFEHADMRGVSFRRANLRTARFYGADLRRSDFSGASLRGVDFRGAILECVDFSGANLDGCVFTSADVPRLRLSKSQRDEVYRGSLQVRVPY